MNLDLNIHGITNIVPKMSWQTSNSPIAVQRSILTLPRNTRFLVTTKNDHWCFLTIVQNKQISNRLCSPFCCLLFTSKDEKGQKRPMSKVESDWCLYKSGRCSSESSRWLTQSNQCLIKIDYIGHFRHRGYRPLWSDIGCFNSNIGHFDPNIGRFDSSSAALASTTVQRWLRMRDQVDSFDVHWKSTCVSLRVVFNADSDAINRSKKFSRLEVLYQSTIWKNFINNFVKPRSICLFIN